MAKGATSKTQSSNVRVVVRVRPTNSMERESGCKTVVKVIDDHMLVFDPKTDSEAVRFGRAPPKSRARNTILDRRTKDLQFAFDRVFNEHATNKEVFEQTTHSVVDSLLEGFNCSVFAYGATSAGKTHTMLGSSEQPGVIFLTMMELYKKIYEKTEEFSCDVSVSYLEIYNENARDLLVPTTSSLAVREDPQKGVCVTGLSLHKPKNAEELLGMLDFGNQNRTQHPTDANKQSSRSHAVFQVFVRQQPKGSGLSTDVKVAKMSLIDLAGSERATVTTNRGARFREGANINRSLLALGNCINALAENKPMRGKKEVHIPYRDSKLTRLLKDSLGGNCKTIMIAAVSPSSTCYEDTYNTLKYADRAKNIKSNLKSNVISVDFHVSKYAKIVEELKQQVEDLKNKLRRFESGEATPMKQQKLRSTQKDQLKIIQNDLCGIYKDRCLIRKQIIDCEAAEKELKIKHFKRERNLKRIQAILDENNPIVEQFAQKLDRFEMATKSKQNQLETKSQSFMKQLADNEEKVVTVKSRADDWLSSLVDESLGEPFILFHEARVSDVEKLSAKAQVRHLRRFALMQERDAHSTERLVSKLLSFIKKQHDRLNQTGSLLPDIEHDYTSLLQDLEGSRRIMWADESTRENLDVGSILNFASCTPMRTPARTRNVLQSNTPQPNVVIANDLFDAEDDYSVITAKNSFFNSGKIATRENDLQENASNEIRDKSHVEKSCVERIFSQNPCSRVSLPESCSLGINTSEKDQVGDENKMHYESLKRNLDSSPASPAKRRTVTLEDDFESRQKVPRFDLDLLPHVPTEEPSPSREAKGFARTNEQENFCNDRRGTMIIQKSPLEVASLPHVEDAEPKSECCNVLEGGSASSTAVKPQTAGEEARIMDAVVECLPKSVSEPRQIIEKETSDIMNATFDVIPNKARIVCEAVPSTNDISPASTELNLSGVEPLSESPDRKPLSVLSDNKPDAIINDSEAANLHRLGLPSMRDGSYLNTGKSAPTPSASKNDHHKLLNSTSKSASKSRYASIQPRLYDENPRYTASSSKTRQHKPERRRRSNTMNNPIRLRDTRRRSRSSTTAAPYSLLSARKNAPGHVLGVRKAIEQMRSIKGQKGLRHFAPVSSSSAINTMPSSAL